MAELGLDVDEEIEQLDQTIQNQTDEKRFIFYPFAVGIDEEGLKVLAKLAAQTNDERLKNTGTVHIMKDTSKFADVFKFVSASISEAIVNGGELTTQLQLPSSVGTTVPFPLN